MSKISDNIKPLSEREVRIISELEFNKKYFFTREGIRHHFDSESKLHYAIHRLMEKKRIIKLNRNKYYLVPIKAKTGRWAEEPFIIADEMFNSKDYYVGGWAAANYWKLTDQIPIKIEVYTNKRNGEKEILSSEFIFRKTTESRIKTAKTIEYKGHKFRILCKEKAEEWMKSLSKKFNLKEQKEKKKSNN